MGTNRGVLRKTSSGWEFAAEIALEDFVWENFEALFGCRVLARQHSVAGEPCDIVAVDPERTLVVVELKNVEDRGVVPQITRYYDNLKSNSVFSDLIDYSRPPRLIVVAPSFHRHNLIDRRYTILPISLLQYRCFEVAGDFRFSIRDGETGWEHDIPLPFSPDTAEPIQESVSEPPKQLLKHLSFCAPAERKAVLAMRSKLLTFDRRLKETVEHQVLFYGSGKSKPCVEIRFQRSIRRPVIFMWLPTPSSRMFEYKTDLAGRLRIWFDESGPTHVGHVPKGFGEMKTYEEWAKEGVPRHRLGWSFTRKSKVPTDIKLYLGNAETGGDWEVLTDMALSSWLKKMS